MDKKIIGGILIVAVIAIGAGFFVMNSDSDKSSTSSSSTSSQTPAASENENKDQVSETNATKLASSGKAQECTFDYDGPEGSADGKMYTDGKGKSRMSITGIKTDQGNTGSSDMIVKDGKYYNWVTTNGQSIGFSGDSTSSANTDSNSSQASGQPTPNQNFSMSCKSWEVDQAKFEVPSNINFNSLNFNVPQ